MKRLGYQADEMAEWKQIARRSWLELLAIMLTIGTTLLVFPGVIYIKGKPLIVPSRPDWGVFVMNATYAVSDVSGRLLGRLRSSYSRSLLTIGIVLKMVITSFAYVTAFSENSSFFAQPSFIIMNLFAMGILNGFLMVASTKSVVERLPSVDRDKGGKMIAFVINTTLLISSLSQLAIYFLVFQK
jgi:hypothetical protein